MDTWIKKINSVVGWLKQKKLYAVIIVVGVLALVGCSPWLFRLLIGIGALCINAKLNRIENKVEKK